jgi:hypothetical protein
VCARERATDDEQLLIGSVWCCWVTLPFSLLLLHHFNPHLSILNYHCLLLLFVVAVARYLSSLSLSRWVCVATITMDGVFDAQEIVEGLWLCDYNSSQMTDDIASHRITHVLCLMSEITDSV